MIAHRGSRVQRPKPTYSEAWDIGVSESQPPLSNRFQKRKAAAMERKKK